MERKNRHQSTISRNRELIGTQISADKKWHADDADAFGNADLKGFLSLHTTNLFYCKNYQTKLEI